MYKMGKCAGCKARTEWLKRNVVQPVKVALGKEKPKNGNRK